MQPCQCKVKLRILSLLLYGISSCGIIPGWYNPVVCTSFLYVSGTTSYCIDHGTFIECVPCTILLLTGVQNKTVRVHLQSFSSAIFYHFFFFILGVVLFVCLFLTDIFKTLKSLGSFLFIYLLFIYFFPMGGIYWFQHIINRS